MLYTRQKKKKKKTETHLVGLFYSSDLEQLFAVFFVQFCRFDLNPKNRKKLLYAFNFNRGYFCVSAFLTYFFYLLHVIIFFKGNTIKSLATKTQTTKFSTANFQKMLKSKLYHIENSKTGWRTV